MPTPEEKDYKPKVNIFGFVINEKKRLNIHTSQIVIYENNIIEKESFESTIAHELVSMTVTTFNSSFNEYRISINSGSCI